MACWEDMRLAPLLTWHAWLLQVKTLDDFVGALVNQSNMGTTQYIVLSNNITLGNITLKEAPDLPLAITVDTVITGWPQTLAVLDCQLLSAWFSLSTPVTLKNMIMLNMGVPISSDHAAANLASGLWLFHPSASW